MFDDFLVGEYFGFVSCASLVVDHLNSQGTVCTVMVDHKSFVIYLFIYLRFIV